MRRVAITLLLAVVARVLAPRADARTFRDYETRAVHVEEAPVIDGRLDDPVWALAQPFDDFTQVQPVEGGAPTYRTEIRLLMDADHLYVGIRAEQPDPKTIVAQRLARDDLFFYDDNITFVLDTFHDQRNGFFFQINPLGGRRDGIFEGLEFENNWNGIWFADATIDADGWSAEFRIPFKSLAFEQGQDTWGFNVSRRVRYLNEEVRWADPAIDWILTDMRHAGNLHGLADAQQGIGLDAVPALTLRRIDNPLVDQHTTEVDPSIDVFYKLLPSLTASLTANTDFAETEADDQKVNLSRFSLFFPEKRDFFLQDSGIFSFGGLERENGIPFFSRKIGIDENAEAVALPIGGKITGRIGPYNIGLLDIQADSHGDVRSRNLAVARIKRNVLEASTLGFIVTRGDPLTDSANSLVGGDFNYRSSTLVPDKVVTGNAWFQHSFTGRYESDEGAYGVKIAYPNDIVHWKLSFKEIQDNFNPALGFVNRFGIRQYDGSWRYRVRRTGRLRTIDTRFAQRLGTNTDDDVQTSVSAWRPIILSSDIDDVLELRYLHAFEKLDAPFEIQEGIFIPAGEYHFDDAAVKAETSRNRPVRLKFEVRYGSFFNGTRLQFFPRLEWRPNAHWLIELEYDENRIRLDAEESLPGGMLSPVREVAFETRLTRLRVNISFNPDISWNTFVQYDNISDAISIQSRVRWIIEEGREFFFVINQGFDTSDGDFRVGRTEPVAKLGWTFRF